ncbi:MAG TPA: hypothetical protein PK639_01075 [Candidatus Woesebacteria bacterium]|nr:hypothetical protein [Candidatus Woesebacteria bacterium]
MAPVVVEISGKKKEYNDKRKFRQDHLGLELNIESISPDNAVLSAQDRPLDYRLDGKPGILLAQQWCSLSRNGRVFFVRDQNGEQFKIYFR